MADSKKNPFSLNVQIVSENIFKEETINFLLAESWTSDSELKLLHNIHDLLDIIRPYGKKLSFNLKFESGDTETVKQLIKKRQKKVTDFNFQKLSQKEIAIIKLLASGLSSSEISERLFISFETVKFHRKNILEKTGAKNTPELINYYYNNFFNK